MILEAFFLTGLSRFAILFFPFRNVASVMGKPMFETSQELEAGFMEKAMEIAFILKKIPRYTPWQSKCLVQALTGQLMLRRRGISSTIYLGISKDENGGLLAHAWLRCGSVVITGDEFMSKYKQVACFGYSK
ncbi:MAG: lasso peptide biosynthesis B2 protein, partial [Clostridia bacterium]|nr:lasso peptide biosynthesis B2 protein [Clostridia bacterium]